MPVENVISLARKLITFETINPPGNEKEIALFVGDLLSAHSFKVEYISFGAERLHLIAELGCNAAKPPVVFSGHFDTVPLGVKSWNHDPYKGEINNGKLYGRGSSDMKGGLAAMILAAIEISEERSLNSGIRFIFTSGEELGCKGATQLVESYPDLGNALGIVIGEPTANTPAIGHKGGLYLNLETFGTTAHSSMPHLGDNAIYKAARAITKIEQFDFGVEKDTLLGYPTINVGTIHGGMNLNSVPDHAGFTIDARTTTKVDHKKLLKQLTNTLGVDVKIETIVDLKPVSSDENDSFVQNVYAACNIGNNTPGFPKSLPYLTDGSVLQLAYGGVPVIILGPGQPEMAHQTDEYCYVENLEKAVDIYKRIMLC